MNKITGTKNIELLGKTTGTMKTKQKKNTAKLVKEPQIEAFRVMKEYQTLSRERKFNVLMKLVEWAGKEISKLRN